MAADFQTPLIGEVLKSASSVHFVQWFTLPAYVRFVQQSPLIPLTKGGRGLWGAGGLLLRKPPEGRQVNHLISGSK
jgi:hypothetical protein